MMLFKILCFSNCNLAIAPYFSHISLVSHLYYLVTSKRYLVLSETFFDLTQRF